jgi:plastocyanin
MTRSVTRHLTLLGPGLVLAFVLAACSSGSTAPTGSASALASVAPASVAPASAAPASAAPASSAPDSGASASGCTVGTAAATVTVLIKDFAFSPETVTVKVGDVVGWTNGDSTAHTATLDDGSCDTGRIAGTSAGQQTFVFGADATGKSFTYHCAIHASMKGTITVTS